MTITIGMASCSLESQPLLSQVFQPESTNPCSLRKQVCLSTKPICLILSWTVFVGSVHFLIIAATTSGLFTLDLLNDDATLPLVIVYFFVAIILVFYPINGFLADIYCGRRNVIFGSLSLLLIFVASLVVVFPIAFNHHFNTIAFIVSSLISVIAVIGISAYGANFIQFGLDQLLEAPSRDQALFVHWAKWCYDCLAAILLVILGLNYCTASDNWSFKWTTVFSLVLVCLCALLFLVALSCWKRHWFHTETRCRNPYKTVANVLSFVWKHSYPLQRSAFTYCDDERPSRLDFAKERYGGPFSTEQVEDVKILLRIVLILLTVGPVFSMDSLSDNLSLAIISLHVGSNQSLEQCPWEMFMTNAGMLRYAVTTILFPAYIWIMFSLFHNRVPKMLNRIGYGVVLYFIGMLSILVVDSIGHHIKKKMTASDCIFNGYRADNFPLFPSLGMHWTVMMPSVILLGIGPSIVTATVFEFIAAQSPHSMKGFLFGVFFAIRGTFQFFGSVAVVVFGSKSIWGSSDIIKEDISGLSRCIVFLSVVVAIDLIVFLTMAKRYKHRERGDRPYDQRFAVDFYTRVIENREKDA